MGPSDGQQQRLRLRVTPAAERAIRSGHPWVFGDSVREENRPGQAGELAVIYDKENRFLAIGLYDPGSPLRVRILHKGKPATIDAQWWTHRLAQTVERRAALFDEKTNGYRCIHGESDGWPGLVLDRYASAYVLKLYSAAWFPRLSEIEELLIAQFSPERMILRLSRNIQDTARKTGLSDGQLLMGTQLESPVVFQETGLRFESDVIHGQKTGFFLDQRENRREVERLSAGKTVLNAFSFSGGFSLYAARGGAKSVTDLDISAHALESSRRNFRLNAGDPKVAASLHDCIQADAFEWLAQTGEKFGLVILDPPALAKKQNERTEAMHGYRRLVGSGLQRVEGGGILVAASCSAHISEKEFFEITQEVIRRSGRRFEELLRTGQPADHPATFEEAKYLKCIYYGER
jgi:23S rRNA (cytosine1962-C5)-methyltransferase